MTKLASYETRNNTGALGDISGNEYRIGISFKLPVAGMVSSAEVYLGSHASSGSFTGQVTLRIETTDGGSPSYPTGTLVNANATKTQDKVLDAWNEFVFPGSFNLNANTEYWIFLDCDNQSDTVLITVGFDNTQGYADGKAASRINGVWSNPDNDGVFRINGSYIWAKGQTLIIR